MFHPPWLRVGEAESESPLDLNLISLPILWWVIKSAAVKVTLDDELYFNSTKI